MLCILEVILPDLADGLNKELERKRGTRDNVKLSKRVRVPLVQKRGTVNGNWAQEKRVLPWTY